ncbi:abscisic acid 8'-hydroxylase 1 isoform X1 [Selaginella moellendorffii]|uniref:abscisic acid 8'-hydroxylase 1 isoform X1 n=1 Tax=Selaginella moellendorffii TaxID=88036 RepID=UPI000D1CA00B|nr:abscisic acid 8'-hydroxylase 1 isoform X1 [Selaginella moellendorffii]|eukprot:XP_024528875.1 abscisic acid 8'-hydroxylase 1 isoform X1 [Selaginella moellendorffii]
MADLALLVLGSAMLLLLALLKLARRSYALGRLPLPPGTMGWPYLGETLQLYSQNPNAFFSSKQKRYGDIFKTHILGCPSVMIASPEAAKFILVSHAHLFKTTFPSSKEGIIGPHALFFHEGEYHRRLRRLVQGCFGPDVIRDLVPELETISIQALDSLDRAGGIINTFQEMKKYAFDVGVLKIFGGSLDGLDKEDLKRAYQTLERGYNSFPIDIAGTPYNAAMKARKRLSSIVSRIILDRRRQQKQADNGRCKDFLSTLMESQDDSCKNLTDDQIADNVIGVIFAAQDTTASVLTWLLKYLKENPALLESVTAEHENIRRSKPEGAKGLTWADTKNMPLTSRVSRRACSSDRFCLRFSWSLTRLPFDTAGNSRDNAAGDDPLVYFQRGGTRRGIQRIRDSQGLESDASVQKHPSQPRVFPGAAEVQPLQIRGASQAQYVHAFRQWNPLMPRTGAGEAGNARPGAQHYHTVQMGVCRANRGRTIRSLPCTEGRTSNIHYTQERELRRNKL